MKNKQKITQRALAKFTTLKNKIAALQAELATTTESLTYALSIGTEVEPGSRIARIATSERRSVSWKEVVIRIKSAGYAQKVLASTKPKTVTTLVVK